ncbi:MAG: PaaI family thioesterase [Gammaproteobacteria bacterium]|nr:PaaI family thioesterase [Gammaproteobacteria bacterium]
MAKVSVEEFNQLVARELEWASETGLRVEEMEAGRSLMRLPYQSRSIRPGGTISGPHMMMLADACMYAVVLSLIGEVKLAVTTNFNINFLRKPALTDLLADGRIIKLGKRLAVVEVSVMTAEERELVAHATGTYSIPPLET